MNEQKVDVTMDQKGDVTILTIQSPRIDGNLSEPFEQQVVQAVGRLAVAKVVLDFSGVRFISSAVLGKLIKLNASVVTDRGGQLKLCSLAPRIAEVFKITGLETLFSIHANREEALRSFKF